MCLPDFERFDSINEDKTLIGYRNWKLSIRNNILLSGYQNYIWNKVIEGPHEITYKNSGIYAYNYNYYNNNNNNNNDNNYNYNYYNNYYYNNYHYYYYYYYYYYNNYNYYHIGGIILQYGKVAIHKAGQRSEYAKIDTLFTIRLSDAKGPKEFLDWIEKFNKQIEELAKKFEAKTIHYQDFVEGVR